MTGTLPGGVRNQSSFLPSRWEPEDFGCAFDSPEGFDSAFDSPEDFCSDFDAEDPESAAAGAEPFL